MLSLAFTEKSLEVQRSVVIEEFKQRYLNQPYGDVWLKLRPLAYKVHPYQWATIGKDISHIEDAKMEDVKSFFKKWYIPNNAILTVSGNCSLERAKELCEKWFQDIPAGKTIVRNLPKEPKQTERRELTLVEEVPGNQIYMAFHCCARADEAFFATDLLSDVLSRGKSSPMYQKLVKEQNLFNDIGAYMMSDLDKSLFIIQGDLVDGVDEKNAEEAIWKVIAEVRDFISDKDLKRVKNKVASTLEFAEMNIANKALHLAYYEMLGDANDSNRQAEFYNRVTKEEIQKVCEEILVKENVSVLNYLSKN
jgi:predicted Zn-dependent peptidase